VNFFDFDGTDMTVRETNIGLYSWTTVSFWGMSVRIAGGGLNIPGLGVSNGVAKVLFSDGIALGVVNLEVRMPRPSPEPEPFREISMEDAIVYRLPGDLLFPFDKHQLIPGQRTADALNRIGNALSNESSEYRFLVIGHTDSIGSAHYNSRLSKRRAETVASWLTGHNYARADSIKTIGRGFEEPVETNSTKAGRAQNRRVEVVVIKKNLWEAYRAD
jgi:outer membrane protein OmpA-like peptidoglycan-associated protein